MNSERIRLLEDRDYQSLPQTLNAAFSSYRDAAVYSLPMLAFFREWMWEHSPSLALTSDSELVGALLAGYREARFEETPLKILHIGPIGVLRTHRRGGLGSKMLQKATQIARANDVDLMTLTTEAIYGAHRLYRRAGFDIIEAYRPRVTLLRPRASDDALIGEIHPIEPGPLTASVPIRPNSIIETGPTPPPLPVALRPQCFRLSGGIASTIQWPILSRRGTEETAQKISQLIQWVPGDRPTELFQLASVAAAANGSTCLYTLPAVPITEDMLKHQGTSLVYRMGRALSPEGKRALAAAEHYCEIFPAP